MTVGCPSCYKYGFVVEPRQQLCDSECPLCGGTGSLDTESVCVCGRPGVFALGKDGSLTCGRRECNEYRPATWMQDSKREHDSVCRVLHPYYGRTD